MRVIYTNLRIKCEKTKMKPINIAVRITNLDYIK